MKCMRCGSEIHSTTGFCESCLQEMQKHPVDPNTPINLPRREKHTPVKRSRKRHLKPEDQIRRLRRLTLWLMALILVLALALSAAVYMLLNQHAQGPALLPGQNYGTETTGFE